MNYSQQRYLERLMRDSERPAFDPFGLHVPFRLNGLDVFTSPDVPRYTLPKEVMPGVPWPPGFRDEINRWAISFLGTTNLVPAGTMLVLGGSYVVGRPSDVVKLASLV